MLHLVASRDTIILNTRIRAFYNIFFFIASGLEPHITK